MFGYVILLMHDITCPPVQPDVKPVEGDSPDDIGDDPGFGLEYDRYLREIVMALEEDESFRKKLEETNMTDIKSGKIAKHLDLVSHQIRERLDEIKRQEMNRLRELAKEKMKQMKGIQRMDETFLHHVDIKNPHSFEARDLEQLIKKATNDLDEIDKKRRNEFKTYEMEKEHERREELKNLDEEHRKAREEEYERMKKRHQDHPKVHHPGSKDQLEDVWEKTDHMDSKDFDPKTFFKMHDLNGDGFLDQDEVEALFQKELDQIYDPNLPEDDMRERYEDMARMREHVFGELDKDEDRLISLDEFLNYTSSQEFQKDEGWKTVDEEQNFTDEEYERYEQMLREHEEKMRAQGLDPNMAQPGMVPLGQDPNVQHMQMPQEGQGMHQQQQQFQQHGQELQFQQHEQQQMRQMGQMQGHAPQGQGPHGMGGQMPGGQQGMGQPQMPGGAGMGQHPMQGGPPGMVQGQMPQGHDGQMPQGQMPQGQRRNIPRPPPEEIQVGQGGNLLSANAAVNQQILISDGQGQAQGQFNQNQEINVQNFQGQQPQKEVPAVDRGVPVQNEQLNQGQGQEQAVKIVVETAGGQNSVNNENIINKENIVANENNADNEHINKGNIVNNENIKAETLGQPAPGRPRENIQDGMPPVQGKVPNQQQFNAQHGQGQDTQKFQGQGQQGQQQQQNKEQPLV